MTSSSATYCVRRGLQVRGGCFRLSLDRVHSSQVRAHVSSWKPVVLRCSIVFDYRSLDLHQTSGSRSSWRHFRASSQWEWRTSLVRSRACRAVFVTSCVHLQHPHVLTSCLCIILNIFLRFYFCSHHHWQRCHWYKHPLNASLIIIKFNCLQVNPANVEINGRGGPSLCNSLVIEAELFHASS